LHKRCYHLLGNEADADDAMSIVMMKLMYSWNVTGPRLKNPIAWVFIVVKNVCIDIHRQKARRVVSDGYLNSDDGLSGMDSLMVVDEKRPYEDCESQEMYRQLLDCMNLLPTTVMAVALLRFRDELDYREIAERLGIREDAARKRVEYARRQLACEPRVRQFYTLMRLG
jgi:RNA polymerase sigma-70 factor (ECF subfamily)